MNKHVTQLLYEYAIGELTGAQLREVEGHLSVCSACAADLSAVRAAISQIPRNEGPPSERQEPAFWTALANEIDARLSSGSVRHQSMLDRVHTTVSVFLTANRGYLLAGCGALAAIAIAVALLLPGPSRVEEPESPVLALQSPAIVPGPTAHLMNEYLKKSKVLLVGLSNHRDEGNEREDLSIERGRSRQLVHEARLLKQQPLDVRSAKLVDDLERIQIELANLDESRAASDVEPIIAGIRQENLLFKIRMTEMLMTARVREREYR